ncbi:MAG: hypothetical protein MZV64_59235 [Ignavibacteriales bacterium]|nr:hypothetical protein [Ignavibacteriales bacterium]
MCSLEIPYAVAQDNDGATWRAYKNQLLAHAVPDRQAGTHPLRTHRRRKIRRNRSRISRHCCWNEDSSCTSSLNLCTS